jgi:hypothetical protein
LQIQSDGLPPGITLVASGQEGKELSDWLFDIRVLDANPIYLNQIYRLKFRFPKAYPIGIAVNLRTSPALLPVLDANETTYDLVNRTS